jgi:hypothetical protein
MPTETLSATTVRAALLQSIEPAWRGLLADMSELGQEIEPSRLLFMVQLAPACLRVVVEARAPEPARLLMSPARLPDDNAILVAARDYLAGVLSAHEAGAADRALAFAGAEKNGHQLGGLYVLMRPATGETRAFLADTRKDLGESLDLGGIVGRMTAH